MSNLILPVEINRFLNTEISNVDELQIVKTIRQNITRDVILQSFLNAVDQGYYIMPIRPFELLNIPIYQSSKLEVNINLFPKESNCQKATGLIHHHGPFRLYSSHLSGLGFDYFAFEENEFLGDRIKEGVHKDSNLYSVEPFDFHVLFGARSATATLAVWIKDTFLKSTNERQSLFLCDGKVQAISELEFSDRLSKEFGKQIEANKLLYVARLLSETGLVSPSELSSIHGFDRFKLNERDSLKLSAVNHLDHLSMGMTKSEIRKAFSRSYCLKEYK